MIAPPLPANETERLADLHALELLDTPAEERFDRLVRLAMAIFGRVMAHAAGPLADDFALLEVSLV